jgi:hypothetical protein
MTSCAKPLILGYEADGKYIFLKGAPEVHLLNVIWPLSRNKKKKASPVYILIL